MPFGGHRPSLQYLQTSASQNFLTATCAYPGTSTVSACLIFTSNPSSFQCQPGIAERCETSLPSPHHGGFFPLSSHEISQLSHLQLSSARLSDWFVPVSLMVCLALVLGSRVGSWVCHQESPSF